MGVALCIKNVRGPDQDVMRAIGVVFAAVFNVREHLDILFLNDTEEAALARVCAPFFESSVSSR